MSTLRIFLKKENASMPSQTQQQQQFQGVDADDSSGMNQAGPRLRAIRHSRGLTLTLVADRADVTKGFLSLLERGKTRVSVPTLLRICQAMGVSIGTVFVYPEAPILQGGTPLQMGGVDISEFLMTPEDEALIQVMRTILKPGGGSGGAYSLEATTIFVTVLRGTLSLTVDSEEMILNAGDSTTFAAPLQHEWNNPGESEAEVLWVIAPPLPRAGMPTKKARRLQPTPKVATGDDGVRSAG